MQAVRFNGFIYKKTNININFNELLSNSTAHNRTRLHTRGTRNHNYGRSRRSKPDSCFDNRRQRLSGLGWFHHQIHRILRIRRTCHLHKLVSRHLQTMAFRRLHNDLLEVLIKLIFISPLGVQVFVKILPTLKAKNKFSKEMFSRWFMNSFKFPSGVAWKKTSK